MTFLRSTTLGSTAVVALVVLVRSGVTSQTGGCHFSNPEVQSCTNADDQKADMRDLVDYYFFYGGEECWEAAAMIDDMLSDIGGDGLFWFQSSDPDLAGLHNAWWNEVGLNENLELDDDLVAKTLIHEGVHHGGEGEGWAHHIETLCFSGGAD